MSYQTAKVIADVIKDIHSKKYLLPAIQREFVWTTYQTERLFDSLMRDYPISSFLFWRVGKEKVKDYDFYEFIRDYHQKDNTHNPKANVSGEEEIIAVLDGQQRLTSIYIALKGTYAYKLPRKRWDAAQSYPSRRLYVNLLKPSEDIDFEYDFIFLTEYEAANPNKHEHWFPVGEILDMKEPHQINQYMIENEIFTRYEKEEASFANKVLSKLHSIIHLKPTISYYLEESDELDKVLNIFIRINSGGTTLSHSDLLLSIATAQWEERDARQEIISFVEEINRIGDGFNFDKDFVLKSCLVLSDFNNIAFKVDNFKKDNMLQIEKNWDSICEAIRLSVHLVSGFGFDRNTLTSKNAIIPIAYYLKKIGLPKNFDSSTHTIADRQNIRHWLLLTLIKSVFSGQADSVLRAITKTVGENNDSGFPLQKIINQFKGTNKSIMFTNEDIENLAWARYGNPNTFFILSLLYPNLDFRNKFHIDHIHPRSKFSHYSLQKRGIPTDKIDTYIEYVDFIGNLQLLEAIPNIEKQDKEFENWLLKTLKASEIADFKSKHFIPAVDLSFENFEEFFEERETLLKEKLKNVLQLEAEGITSESVGQETELASY
jgi:uncharacterized protein with ParB-like and HNH nuclease domain